MQLLTRRLQFRCFVSRRLLGSFGLIPCLSRRYLVALLERLSFGTILSQGLEAAQLAFNPAEALAHIVDIFTNARRDRHDVFGQLLRELCSCLVYTAYGPVSGYVSEVHNIT